MNEREALERIAKYPMSRGEEMSIETAREIARAALASQAQQKSKAILVGEVNNKYGDPEAFAERSYYIDEQVLQTVPIGYKLVAIPPAPEGGE